MTCFGNIALTCRVGAFVLIAQVIFGTVANGRTWSDRTGKFSVEAEFVDLVDDTVHLKKADGSMLKVPLAKLSNKDQAFAKKTHTEIKELKEARERKEGLEYEGGKLEVPASALVQLDITIINPSDNQEFVMGARPGFVLEVEGVEGVIAITALPEMARLSPPLLGDDLKAAIKKVEIIDDARGKHVAKGDELLLVPQTPKSDFDNTCDFVAVRILDAGRLVPLKLQEKPPMPDDIGLLIQPEQAPGARDYERSRMHKLFKVPVRRASDNSITFNTEPEHLEQISSMTGPPLLNSSGEVVAVYTNRARRPDNSMLVMGCPAALLKTMLKEAAAKDPKEL